MKEFQNILRQLKASANPTKAGGMKAYMRNQFDFFGISSPERKILFRPFLKGLDSNTYPNHRFVHSCYERDERECQYLAMEYLFFFRKNLSPASIDLIRYTITHRSWWDTVDFIASNILGHLVLRFPEVKEGHIGSWIDHQDMWLRRSAILFQLKYKQNTDKEFLARSISKNLGSDEFFINKAIGWALRQYSKSDPEWVEKFVMDHKLPTLSHREAIKYI